MMENSFISPGPTPLATRLAENGIVAVSDLFSIAELAKINSRLDEPFKRQTAERRAYVRADEMLEAGILDLIFCRNMRNLILSLVPDPVLYHLHAYEIAGKADAPHIFGERAEGWHRDPDSEYYPGLPTHLSVFVYLSDVGLEDGPFEFCLQNPESPLQAGAHTVSMTGPAGTSFIWHRSYYHRASPNRGSRRRRLIKLSFQPNRFESAHLKSDFFRRLDEKTPEGDLEFDILVGRFQGKLAPLLKPTRVPMHFDVAPTGNLNLSVGSLKQIMALHAKGRNGPVAYD